MDKAVKKVPGRRAAPKRAARKPAVRGSPASGESTEPHAPKNLLTAGIKALSQAHGEAVARQSRVFESLLGFGHQASEDAPEVPAGTLAAAALDPFGFRKFEDVFDQRVARTLQRLGIPSTEAFAALTEEVERLRREVASLKARPKPAGDKR